MATTGRRLRTSAGALVQLGECIASSGEGEVYRTDRPDRLAKLYHAMDEARSKKLRAMVANPPSDPTLAQGHPSIAWPIDLVAENGRPVGFVMARIDRAISMNAIYNPRLRLRHAPGFNWYYLHIAALNVSWIVQAIHAKGYVIGDLKTDNLLVDPGTMVTIIDTDSFQVPDPTGGAIYRCPVGSEGFTPPELIGRDFADIDRTEVHDRFGLAVIIHLLLAGYHPFNGEWQGAGEPPPRDELIRRGHWPYAETSKLKPGSAAIPPAAYHPAVEDCFRRAFDIGHVKPRGRPTAREWYHALRAAADDLVPCDANPAHLHASRIGACPWCRRAVDFDVDVFPSRPGADTQPIILVKRFERALARGEERPALELWARHPELAQLPYTAHHGKRVKRLIRLIHALDRFVDVWRRDPTNDDLLHRLWRGPPDLGECQTARSEMIGGRPIAEVADEIGRRAEAIAALRDAVRRASRPSDQAGEAAILAAHDGASELFTVRVTRLRTLLARVELARRRVARWTQLKGALEADDDHAIAAAWGGDGLLDEFADVAAHRARIARAGPRARAFDAFLAHWRDAPEDDDGLWARWRAEPDLGGSAVLRRPCVAMAGLVPYERAEMAGRRVEDRQRLKAAATQLPIDPCAVAEAWEAAAWDGARCQDHPDIAALWPTIQACLDGAVRLGDIQTLIEGGDDAAIAAAWDETALGSFAVPAGVAARVGEAVARVGFRHGAFRPLLTRGEGVMVAAEPSAIQADRTALSLRWVWPCDGPPLAVIAVRHDRFPTAPDDVTERGCRGAIDHDGFAATGSARLETAGPDIFAAIWPARLVAGQPIVPLASAPLRLARARALRLSYGLRRQWLRRGSLRLRLTARAAFDAPALLVYAGASAVPDSGIGAARIICRIPPMTLAPEDPVEIDLPALDKESAGRFLVRLSPEDPHDLAWLAIDHPKDQG